MTTHTEWVRAADVQPLFAAPGDYTDDHGTTNDDYVLLLGSDDVAAIEGSLEDLEALFTTALSRLAEVRAAKHPEHDECADGCGLDVTHTGPCLDKPGGRICCEHEE